MARKSPEHGYQPSMFRRSVQFAIALSQLALHFARYIVHEHVPISHTNAESPFFARYVINPLQFERSVQNKNIARAPVGQLASGRLKAILKRFLRQSLLLLVYLTVRNSHLGHT